MAENDQPVVGIVTVPSELQGYPQEEYSNLDASYVKYMEYSGALVVPIQWDWTHQELDQIFAKIDGILLTGGETKIYINDTQPGYNYNKFTDTVNYLIKKAIQENEKGNVFPVIGICQGFQIMNYIASDYYPVLQPVINDIQQERLLTELDRDAYMFNDLPSEVFQYITNEIGPFMYHFWGVFPKTFEKSESLNKFYQITSLSHDQEGTAYVASMEAYDYPFYGFQFHPEKHQFEFATKSRHTFELIQMGQHFTWKFVQKCRENKNQMDFEELQQRVIYNYQPLMIMQIKDLTQSQIYVFKRDKKQKGTQQKKKLRIQNTYY